MAKLTQMSKISVYNSYSYTIPYLPIAKKWSIFWKYCFKQQFLCRFDIAVNVFLCLYCVHTSIVTYLLMCQNIYIYYIYPFHFPYCPSWMVIYLLPGAPVHPFPLDLFSTLLIVQISVDMLHNIMKRVNSNRYQIWAVTLYIYSKAKQRIKL